MSGAIEIVDPGFLPSWGQTLIDDSVDEPQEVNSPFPQDDQLNRKVILWNGDLLSLKVESIVSCNNERFTSMEGVTGDIMRRVGPQLRAFIEGECGQDGCRTGDGICSPTFGRLPAPHILHAIAPRYTPQYHDAAVYALHSCVRRVFEIAKENNIHEVAFSVLHTESKKFPHGLAIGVCLRTIRRMLEHYRAWFYRVIICTQDDQQLKEYEATMPVYFPRTPAETRRVVHMLPPDVGNEFGEPVRQGRETTATFVGLVGRPADKPAAPAATATSSVTRSRPTTFLSSSAAKPAHATKTNDIGVFSDFRETEADERKPSGEEEEVAEAAARRAYRTCVEQARTMDLSKLSAANYIYSAGKDKQGRNVIVLIGSRLPKFSYDKVFYHLCAFLDDQMSTEEPFIIVYVHTNFESDNQPDFEWLKSCYKLLPNSVKDNMKRIFLLHPTYWLRFCFWWASSYVSESFWPKLTYVDSIYAELSGADFSVAQLQLPDFVLEYDAYYYGAPLQDSKP